MRPLNRPMFRYGGPIKEGIMDGIREPKKNGGPTGTGLVGDQRYPKTNGREHHYFFLPAIGSGLMAAVRAAPAVYRGFKAARTFTPGKLGTFGRIKDIFSPSGRFRKTEVPFANVNKQTGRVVEGFKPGKDLPVFTALRDPQRLGAAIRENPALAFSLASALPQGAVGTYKAAIAAGKSAPELAKLYVDLVLPGEQFRKKPSSEIEMEGGPPGGGNPDMFLAPKGDKPPPGVQLTDKEKRQKRIDRYRDIMDIKGMNKAAAYDSLIAASKAISESGDFKGDLKSGKLINQIIQSTSKAFDKPKATKDAIDTLILKGEIEKDIKASDPSSKIANELNLARIDKLNKELEGTSFAEAKIAASKTTSGQAGIDLAASVSSDDFRGNLLTKTQLTDVMEKAKGKGEISEQDIIIAATTEVIKGKNLADGDYTVGDVLVTIKKGQVTDIKR